MNASAILPNENFGTKMYAIAENTHIMVELLNDFPPYVAAYKATGHVNKEEYEHVVMARINEVAAHYGKINFLVLMETEVWDYSFGSLVDYVKMTFEHFKQWNRLAVVSNEQWVNKVYDVLGGLVYGEVKSFKIYQYEEARQWISQPIEQKTANA